MRTLSVGPAPSDPLWVQMLTIFVPALAALLVAVIGQTWSAAAARRAEERAAWRTLQQGTLTETQNQLMGFWLATAKIMRGLTAEELKFALQDASARLKALRKIRAGSSAKSFAPEGSLSRAYATFCGVGVPQ